VILSSGWCRSARRYKLSYRCLHEYFLHTRASPLVRSLAGPGRGHRRSHPWRPQAGDDAPHKIVYQLNHHEPEYQEAILNSISALLKKYVDDVAIVVVAWGPGIHLLAKKPQRPVPELHQQRVRSMAEAYGVRFIACGNTMHTVGWTAADMVDFAEVEEVGAAAVMELQERGYAYLAW
jgi:intracellular sulfur oxidation DsrE/DsrF family protein